MMFNRRNFVQSAACVAAAPVLANFLSSSSVAQLNTLLAEPTPVQNSPNQLIANSGLFKISGWDCCHDIGVGHTQTISVDRTSKTLNDGRTLIRITQSWRTAWR
jgi:hypothetical protein